MRSKLFVPASRPEFFAKALTSEADAISFDLEDSVQETRKRDARQTLQVFLKATSPRPGGKVLIVRVNGIGTPHFEADVAAVAWPGVDMINLPKPESAEDVRAAAAALVRVETELGIRRPIGILANIESPQGLRLAVEIARAHPRVVGLQLGLGDLFEPFGIDRADARAVHATQLAVRLAAAEAGVWACDTVYGTVADSDGFVREAEAARRLGYIGKSCIHPSQVPLANAVFRPTDAEIAAALAGVDHDQVDVTVMSGTGMLTLPAIVAEVGRRIEVHMDGGIRSGQDVLKAWALGARGTYIGRAMVYGLGALGEDGRLLEAVVHLDGERVSPRGAVDDDAEDAVTAGGAEVGGAEVDGGRREGRA